MEFGDLSEDKVIQQKLVNFHNSVENINKMLELAMNSDIYDKLNTKEKVDYDLFIAYSLNTLYWLFLRTKGEDPRSSEVKNQLNRIKEYMKKAKEAHERLTIRPVLDKPAARRFIKHGIHNPDNATVQEPPNKKIKLS